MEQINLFTNELLNVTIKTITDNNDVLWFRAKDIAVYLAYTDTKQAIRVNVDDDYKTKLCDIETAFKGLLNSPLNRQNRGVLNSPLNQQNRGVFDTPLNQQNSIYINESGLYQLLFSSKKFEAKQFTKWIIEEILPSIRKTGKYNIIEQPKLLDKQISLLNERDLHFKVIDYIRKYYPDALLYAGLGELQDTANKRIYAKACGYMKGQSDIIINNLHKTFNGLTIELKTPNGKGVVHEKQHAFMNMSVVNGHKVLLSNDYDEIITQIINYMRDIRIICVYCSRKFKTIETLNNHHKYIHRITNI